MATLVQISGDPGTGKTFGCRTLPPQETYMVNVDKKGLSWGGWRKDYNAEAKNFARISDGSTIAKVLKQISDNRPDIKYIVVDTINTIMSDKEMAEIKKPGYDKWKDLAIEVYELYTIAHELREDLIIFFMAHIMPVTTEDFGTKMVTKVNGQKLSKVNLNSKLTYNLYTHVERAGKEATYSLLTQSDGKTEARSVHGVLEYKIPNDLYEVAKQIREKDLML